jgi:hypothetical protein
VGVRAVDTGSARDFEPDDRCTSGAYARKWMCREAAFLDGHSYLTSLLVVFEEFVPVGRNRSKPDSYQVHLHFWESQ